MKKLLKVLLGVFAFLLFLAVYSAKDSAQPSAAYTDGAEAGTAILAEDSEQSEAGESGGAEASMAVIIAQGKVQDQLKSPSTADFEMFNGEATDKGNGLFVVRDHVDSQNGYGATVRSEYVVELQFNGGDQADPNSWTVKNMAIE